MYQTTDILTDIHTYIYYIQTHMIPKVGLSDFKGRKTWRSVQKRWLKILPTPNTFLFESLKKTLNFERYIYLF